MLETPAHRPWRGRLAMALVVSAACAILYAWIGFGFAKTPVFWRNNYMFYSDPHRVIGELADSAADHSRTRVHPLFVLLFNPLGSLLGWMLGSDQTAAITLNVVFGGLAAGTALLVFLALGLAPRHALLYTALIAFSTTHMVYGSIPEVYIFASFSMMVLVLVAVLRPLRRRPLVPVGVLTTGILTSNAVPTLAVVFFGELGKAGVGRAVRRTVEYGAVVLAVVIALSGLQRILYHNTQVFVHPDVMKEESYYLIKYTSAGEFVERVEDMLGGLLVFNVVAPDPLLIEGPVPPDRNKNGMFAGKKLHALPRVTFRHGELAFRWVGGAAALLWAALLILASRALARDWGEGRDNPLKAALIASLAFHFVLHMIWGVEPFQYSGNWTFMLIAVVALGLRPAHEQGGFAGSLATMLLAALAPLQFVGNLSVVRDLIAIYR